METVAAAIDGPVLKGDLGPLHEAGPQQHTVSRHAHDVALEAAKVGEEDLNGLLLALAPAFGDPLVPVGDLLLRAGEGAIGGTGRGGPDANEVDAPVRRCG